FTARGGAASGVARPPPAGESATHLLPGGGWRGDGGDTELRGAPAPHPSATPARLPKPFARAAPGPHEGQRPGVGGQRGAAPDTELEGPDPLVQNVWRAHVVGNVMIAVGDRMHYSAGNAYDHLYEAECGDAVRALLLYGHAADARRMVGPLLYFNRQVTRFHV